MTRIKHNDIIDKIDYLANLRSYRAEMNDLRVAKTGGSFDHYRNFLTTKYDTLHQVIEEIDFAKLTRKDVKVLTELMLQTLPQKRTLAIQIAPISDWDDVNTRIGGAISSAIQRVAKINARQAAKNPQKLKTVPRVDSDASWQVLENGNRVIFPEFKYAWREVQEPYVQLRKTWEQASLKTLSVEDSYQLGAIATDYLPESIRLLTQLSERSSLARTESERMFIRQLSLLQQQVDEILAKETAQTLSTMEAHTRFLENKVRKPVAVNN